MMMIACAVFGFVMNSIGKIFKEFYKLDTEIENKLYAMTGFMN
jgi:hypothetical protein